VTPTEPLTLHHSWPLSAAPRKFEHGSLLNCAISDALEPRRTGEVGPYHAGLWECDLGDNSLAWSGGVYDIFGLPRGVVVTRNDVVKLYSEDSRAAMERLRAHAIKHMRGFTIDVQIRVGGGLERWVRLITTPICEGGRATRLQGLKLAI
jgi:PAS domain-containing protein